ncbi:MAG: isopeptide-forming domain-containing fimbrial protein, partial [Firmicutes bacterium]|nr:isopeptide-forming domain-containing fimbrial protein [Bacillota bacterium]
MKNRKLLALLLTLVLAIGLIPMTAFAAQRDVTASSTASITINGAVENDVLAAYKVVDITYNSTTNTLVYAWNSDFADYFNQTNSITNSANRAYTVEEFAALSDDLDANQTALKNLLAGLPNYIVAKNIAAVQTKTVAAGGTATFAGLAMGEYFIRPTSTTSVYQLMLQKVEPTVVNGTYVIDDVTFTAKHKEVTVDKTADKTSVTKGEKVNYTIKVDIPTYATQAVDKSFSVADLLPDGLTIDTGSIKVQVEGVDVAAAAYDLNTTATDEYTFKLSV